MSKEVLKLFTACSKQTAISDLADVEATKIPSGVTKVENSNSLNSGLKRVPI